MLLRAVAVASLAGLAACSSSSSGGSGTARYDSPPVITTGFATLDANDQIKGRLDPDASSSGSNATGDIGAKKSGYSYLTETKGNAVTARAALINPGAIANRSATGAVTYDAAFKISDVADTDKNFDITETTGTLPITVRFGDGRITGNGDGLRVAGQMTGDTAGYRGTVTWRGVDGALRGRAGDSGIIGAFSGAGPKTAFSGGFTGAKAP